MNGNINSMLNRENNNRIICNEHEINLGGGISAFAKVLSNTENNGRTALLIHGGGITGNHTLSERPAKWLINRGIFGKVIIPDRRGAGASSPFNYKINLKEQSEDIKKLLDELKITEPVTAIGTSYGGPIALMLAAIDPRVVNVILIASSPRLTLTMGKLKLFYQTGIMQAFIKLFIWTFAGSSYRKYVDMDFVYDIKTVPGLIKAQIKILRQMNRRNIRSFFLMVDSVFDKNNMSIPENFRLNIPVFQIIGDKDTVWDHKCPKKYYSQFPLFRQIIIKGARHRDVFFRAEEFLIEIKPRFFGAKEIY